MAKLEITIDSIIRELKKNEFHPIYYLMGEEPYYIDKISEYIATTILTEEEREFNQTIFYGSETDIATIITTAKRYPMMSTHQIIIVKEAQNLKNVDELCHYLQKPQLSTILVFCHKNGVLDRRKKLISLIEKYGILYESKKIRDSQLPNFISNYLKKKSITIETKATEILSEFVGGNLSRLTSELEKLIITLPQQKNHITSEQIEKNIGISKDYNNFELKNALIEKNIFKANQIIKYFEGNPKNNPLQMTLSLLFNFFSNLMIAYYAPLKNEQGITIQLNLKNSWQAKEYITAMQRYSGVKVMKIIAEIRYSDAKSKGIGNSSQTNGEILKELVYKIIH